MNIFSVDAVLAAARVKPEPGKGATLNGNNTSRLLEYLAINNSKIPYLDVFRSLREVQKWSVAENLAPEAIDKLEEAIKKFSITYRSHGDLNRINKLHELEVHTIEFVRAHGSWGLYSEQSLEGVHKYSNKADRQSFGKNQDNNVLLFMKRQLFCSFSVEY